MELSKVLIPKSALVHHVAYVAAHAAETGIDGELLTGPGGEALALYLLFEQAPHLIPGPAPTPEQSFYNRYFWLKRFAATREREHGTDAGIEQQLFQLLEGASFELDGALLRALDERAAEPEALRLPVVCSLGEPTETWTATSVDELRSLLTRLHDAQASSPWPEAAFLEFQDKWFVIIGVGHPETYLLVQNWQDEGGQGREWVTIGDPTRRGEIDYVLLGHHTPHSEENVIPWQAALEILLRLVEEGRAPEGPDWDYNEF